MGSLGELPPNVVNMYWIALLYDYIDYYIINCERKWSPYNINDYNSHFDTRE